MKTPMAKGGSESTVCGRHPVIVENDRNFPHISLYWRGQILDFDQHHRAVPWADQPGRREFNCQHGLVQMIYMDVSENSGTPKSSILIGFSIIHHPFWGTPIFGNTHMRTRQKCWWRSLYVRRSFVLKVAPNYGKQCWWTTKSDTLQLQYLEIQLVHLCWRWLWNVKLFAIPFWHINAHKDNLVFGT